MLVRVVVGRGVSRISVSVHPDLLGDFDETISRMGYNRSRAIQVAMRNFLTEHRWEVEDSSVVAGTITMIYDHEVRGLEEALTDIQHEHMDVISSTTHVHLDERNCLEIVAVKGRADMIRSLAKRLMATRGVKQLKLAILMP